MSSSKKYDFIDEMGEYEFSSIGHYLTDSLGALYVRLFNQTVSEERAYYIFEKICTQPDNEHITEFINSGLLKDEKVKSIEGTITQIAEFVNQKHWITKTLVMDVKECLKEPSLADELAIKLLKKVVDNCIMSLSPKI